MIQYNSIIILIHLYVVLKEEHLDLVQFLDEVELKRGMIQQTLGIVVYQINVT